ncbi:ATP-binding protein [Hymenobacter sp. BT770]|uniref:sensor histidine kinase n=1 Tax=Hymenobacter sp. BT770 TaxID=2886942 RepID=UPI001D112AF3|nr:ATP-binding protein [Hymenobacter sp. BT770]MCC3155300.1 HAMP domain-containing protein [Hymenobacter sp. BT770]MDO3417297.1 ATP-binding protein [Hymenobacter sp. BT770]
MSIRTRLTLFFAGLMLALVAAVSCGVYFFERNSQRNLFEGLLLRKAEATAKVYVRKHERLEPTDAILLLTQQNQYEAIYNEGNKLVYASRPNPELLITPRFLQRARAAGRVHLSQERAQGVALFYQDGRERFVVVVTAEDKFGQEALLRLRNNLFITNILGLALVVALANLFAGHALRPVQRLSREIQALSSRTLDQRLSTGNGRDELARLSAQFNALLARLADTVAQNRNFVWHASHELRTPLANLLGTLDISRAYDERPQELRATLTSATEEVRRLISLTNDLLLLAELSQEKPAHDLLLEPVLLTEPLLDAVQAVQRRYPATTIELHLPEAVEDCQARAHAELLTLALINLLDNACKYSPPGSPVLVSLAASPGGCTYTVRDTGVGIGPDALPHIFEPMYRAEAVRARFSGNGVGLSLVQRVAELHGGGITAKSVVGEGTEFKLWL